jgi:lysophospholipase L1-like esterase
MLSLLPLLLLQPPADPKDAARFAKWEKDVAAIETRLKDSPPKSGGVVFAGSSSIRLWDVKKSFPDLDAANVGFGGSEVRDSTHFAGRIITPLKPRAVVVYAGDNDLNSGRTPEQVAADFKAFVESVRKEVPGCRVLFVAVKPSPKRWAQFEKQTKANALVRDYCMSTSGLTFVDVVPLMLGPDRKPVPELYAKDELHLSPAGYEKWTAAVKAALAK